MEWFNLEAEELVDVFLTSDDADALVLLQHSIEVSLSRAYELEPTPAGLFATINMMQRSQPFRKNRLVTTLQLKLTLTCLPTTLAVLRTISSLRG